MSPTHLHYAYVLATGYQDFVWYHTEEAAEQAARGAPHTIVSEPCKCQEKTPGNRVPL